MMVLSELNDKVSTFLGRAIKFFSNYIKLHGKYLIPPLTAGTLVYFVYIFTHQYPTHISGLYLVMAESIIDNGYTLPKIIPHYTESGLPWAYPPLMFYVGAILLDVGISGNTIATYLPGLIMITYLLAVYIFLVDIFDSQFQASLATTLIALTPRVFYLHLIGGGWVRGVGFLWVFLGFWAGLRMYKNKAIKWVIISSILFGLTILTHPICTLYFVVGFLLLYMTQSRTVTGLLMGAAVAGGGVLISSPFWVTVALNHGLEIFISPTQTVHNGSTSLIEILYRIIGINRPNLFVAPVFRIDRSIADLSVVMWNIGILGGIYALFKRKYTIPVIFIVTMAIMNQFRFQEVWLPILAVPLVVEIIIPTIATESSGETLISTEDRHKSVLERISDYTNQGWSARESLVGLIIIVLIISTALAGSLTVAGTSTYTPESLNDENIQAMTWVEENTPRDSSFVTIGGRGEWFPYYANRTILLSPWGTEWTQNQSYHMRTKSTLSRCTDAGCISTVLIENDINPDYIYMSKSTYQVGLIPSQGQYRPIASMNASGRFTNVFENRDVVVFKLN